MGLKKSAADLVAEAKAQIDEITASEAIPLHGDDGVIFVDLRDVRERERMGYIPGAVHCPRGMAEFWIDPDSPYYREVFGQADKRYVFHCASGWRSALTVKQLQEMGFAAEHISDGFGGWVKAGGPVEGAPEA